MAQNGRAEKAPGERDSLGQLCVMPDSTAPLRSLSHVSNSRAIYRIGYSSRPAACSHLSWIEIMSWSIRVLTVVLVLVSSCVKQEQAPIVFPDTDQTAHYDLHSSDLSHTDLSRIGGNILSRIDDKLIYLRSDKTHHKLEYIAIDAFQQFINPDGNHSNYDFNTRIVLHNEELSFYHQQAFDLPLSSWVASDSLMLSNWPASTAELLGVRAGMEHGDIVYSVVEDQQEKVMYGSLRDSKYSEKQLILKDAEVEPYAYYENNCKVMLMNDYTCLWFPAKQLFVFKLQSGKEISYSLDALLQDSSYSNSALASPGLVCDDGTDLYIGIYTPQQLIAQNILKYSISSVRSNAEYTLIKVSIASDMKVANVRKVDDLRCLSEAAVMEYFEGFVLVLSNYTDLDTVPVKSD